MTAHEARTKAMSYVPLSRDTLMRIVNTTELAIATAASRGYYSTSIDMNSFVLHKDSHEYAVALTQHFSKLGYKVNFLYGKYRDSLELNWGSDDNS